MPGMSIVGSASHMNQLTQDFMAKHKDPSPVQVGSSLKFLLVRTARASSKLSCFGAAIARWLASALHLHCAGAHCPEMQPRGVPRSAQVNACTFQSCLCSPAVACVQVAEGLAHVYPRLAPTCEWDTAAAQVIVEEAGGSVVQAGLCDNKGNALENWEAVLRENRPVVYNKENLLNPFFVVYGKRTDA